MTHGMRTVYHEKLSELGDLIGQMCGVAGTAVNHATQALLAADLAAAEQVITDHDQLAVMAKSAESAVISLLARQQPVGRDLREIVGALQIAANVERMGGLAVHVAKLARRRHPHHVVPKEVNDTVAEMGCVAGEMANFAREVLRTRDPAKATALRQEDDAMDGIHRQLLTILMDERIWTYGIPAAVDVALLGRFYERFADRAVEVGRRVVFEAPGQLLADQDVGTY